MFRCKHDWVLCFGCYAPPVPLTFAGAGSRLTEEMLFGVTSLLWECSKCQAVRNERLLGQKVELPHA